ncbi:hypothetical protein CEXT_388651 [Caerostris extrusa]|uniref:Uncharacterized protein n=1 Tax=Caerostris extrusa TaxID=172846 RepID=A0AAV4T8S3_CAEEX|nr:hypothetical protein CEXT_388651 [Caerostris extrusa]
MHDDLLICNGVVIQARLGVMTASPYLTNTSVGTAISNIHTWWCASFLFSRVLIERFGGLNFSVGDVVTGACFVSELLGGCREGENLQNLSLVLMKVKISSVATDFPATPSFWNNDFAKDVALTSKNSDSVSPKLVNNAWSSRSFSKNPILVKR